MSLLIVDAIKNASQQIDQIDAYQARRLKRSIWHRMLTWPLALYLRRRRRGLSDRLLDLQRRRGVI